MFDGETFQHNGHNFRLEITPDDYAGAPWDSEDGHGPVSDWTRNAKGSGDMVLAEDRGSRRLYDFAEAVKIAKRDGWNAAPYDDNETKGQRAHKAALADFNRLRDWCNDRWCYVGVVVHLLDDVGDDMGESESLWGIESDAGDYLDETARELADEILHRLSREIAA